MSYILGALKKAEQERKGDSEPDFEDWNSSEWNTHQEKQPPSLWLRLIFFSVILLLLAILVSLWLLLRQQPESEPSISESAPALESEPLTQQPTAGARYHAPKKLSASAAEIKSANSVDSNTDGNELPDADVGSPKSTSDVGVSEPNIPAITGHLYFPTDASLNRVFLNGGSYGVGDSVAKDLVIVEITDSQAVFEWRQGKRYPVRF